MDSLITIIAGSREGPTRADVDQAVADCGWEITRVVSGAARGADRLGESWARDHGISIDRYPADWDRHGKKAGYLRNAEMSRNAEALIVLWDGQSPGSHHMIDLARKAGLRVFIRLIRPACTLD